MRASTGGPLAAFLMIAPLVAIPVFAVVGIPNFAPAVSSAVGDEEISDPGLPQIATSKSAPAAKPAAKTTAVDDLFAPMDSPKASATAAANGPRAVVAARPDRQSSADGKSRNSAPGKGTAGRDFDSDDTLQWIPPAEALDGWALAEQEKPSRGTLKPTAKEVARTPAKTIDEEANLDDLPPEVTPKSNPRTDRQPRIDDGWQPERSELPAPTSRKPLPRNAAPKKKKIAATSESGMNFANVLESQDDAGAVTVERSTAPKARDTTAPRAATEIKTVSASTEKISLSKFTQGLIHPIDEQDRPAPATQPVSTSAAKDFDTAPRKPAAGRRAKSADLDEPITWELATQRLKELGIGKYTLEAIPSEGRYLFICQLTPANNPSVRRRFEDVADEPLLAVQKVLRQIEEWQSHR